MRNLKACVLNPRWILPRLALIATTVLWGSSFFVMKTAVGEMSPITLLFWRNLVAFAVASAFLPHKYKGLRLKTLRQGAITGACLFAGSILQIMGLTDTTPGKSSFLTASYCIMVPFIYWLFTNKKPDRYHVVAALICVAGVGLVSLEGSFTIGLGDGLTLACAAFSAAQIACIAIFSEGKDIMQFSLVQFGTGALLSFLGVILADPAGLRLPNHSGCFSILYLGVFCTACTLLLQNYGQKNMPPAQAAIIMSQEGVFGVLFSVAFYGERISLKMMAGFALILFAVIVSETKLGFSLKKKGNASR